jgi:hypothetical protein
VDYEKQRVTSAVGTKETWDRSSAMSLSGRTSDVAAKLLARDEARRIAANIAKAAEAAVKGLNARILAASSWSSDTLSTSV